MYATPLNRTHGILLTLALLMLVTRFHHFGAATHLPDASLAVCFLGGFYLHGWRPFLGLLALAGVIDYIAITQFSVSDYCISPAYILLIPAYASLWVGGRYAAEKTESGLWSLPLLASILLAGTTLAFLISSGGFYLLSGKFPDLSWSGYALRVARYYPPYLEGTLFYVILALGLQGLIHALQVRSNAASPG